MSLIYALALSNHLKDNKKASLKYAESMSEFLNENAFGTPEKPGNYHGPVNEKTGELGEVKFNDGVAKNLELVLVQKVLPHFLNEASKLTDWKECITLLILPATN
jgi:hypothetical protein